MLTIDRPADVSSLDMISKFIGFDTTSSRSNLPLIGYVADFLQALGIEPILTYNADRTKANLFATIGPSDRPGIVLSGHTDTVPVEGQAWTSDPYSLALRNGALFGRGVCDMKGFLAIATAFAPEFARRNLSVPIHLALSFDEEVGCLGVPLLIDDIAKRGIKPFACIVGEPSGMGVIRAHKGKIGGRVIVTGVPAHTGIAHLGVNAVEAAGEAIAHFKSIQRRIRDNGPYDRRFEDPKFTTIQCCLIDGGTAINIVAGRCEFQFDIRYLPGENPEDYVDECKEFVRQHIEPDMKQIDANAGFTWIREPGAEALSTGEDEDVTLLAKELAETNVTSCVGFGTEAGHFQAAGIPTIICGPGAIEQAHKADEFVTLDQVERCERFLWRLIDKYSR